MTAMTAMTRPCQSEAQRLGAEAQAAFAAFVARKGDVWNPTAANADFGIDGRVELASQGAVSGVEFAVQIKGATTLTAARNGTVSIGQAKASTVRYWFSRLTPTLLVGYDTSRSRFFAGWAHELKDIYVKAADPKKLSLTLRVSGKAVDDARWNDIHGAATTMHLHALESVGQKTLRRSLGMLYIQTSEVADVLVELASKIAFDARFEIGIDGVTTKVSSAPRVYGSEPQPSTAAGEERSGANIWAAFNLTRLLMHIVDAFVASAPKDMPVLAPPVALVIELAKGLRSDAPRKLRDLGRPGGMGEFHWVTVDGATIIPQLLAVTMRLRDFNRELRRIILPEALESESLLLECAEPSWYVPLRMFRALREESLTPAWKLAQSWR